MFFIYNSKVLYLYYLFKYINIINIFISYFNSLYKNKTRFKYYKKNIKAKGLIF